MALARDAVKPIVLPVTIRRPGSHGGFMLCEEGRQQTREPANGQDEGPVVLIVGWSVERNDGRRGCFGVKKATREL
jgi:hypothetical protein